jgi:pimeloyl-ACP methyl ester carboxylesterase
MASFTSFDGTTIDYNDVGDGPVTVLLHGFAADRDLNWERPGVVSALVDSGRRVVATDARGHGRSGKPHDPAAYANDAMVRDVVACLDHLGVGECGLAGYSMGALIGARVALAEPRVKSLVLGGIGGRVGAQGRPPNLVGLAEALEAADPSTIADPVARAFRAFAESTGADRLALAAVQRGRVDRSSNYQDIKVPTLVIVGDNDELAGDPSHLASLIPGATSRVVSGTHLSAINDPAFTSSIVEFFAAVGPATAG